MPHRAVTLSILALAAAPSAGADSLRLTVGARVINRCSAAGPVATLRCAVPPGAIQRMSIRTAEGRQVTVLF